MYFNKQKLFIIQNKQQDTLQQQQAAGEAKTQCWKHYKLFCRLAVLGFGWVVGVGFVGAWALAAAGLLAVGVGLGSRLGGVPRGLGGGVLDEDVVVVVGEVVVVVEVVESEAEERAEGDGGGSWASGAGV